MTTLAQETSKKSVTIYDAVCGIEKGHTLATLKSYSEWFNKRGYNPICVFTSGVKKEIENTNVNTTIPWIYNYYLPRKPRKAFPLSHLQSLIKVIEKIRISKKLTFIPQTILNTTNHTLSFRLISKSLHRALMQEKHLLFLPGADTYTILALSKILTKSALKRLPTKIVIRMMGVMENAGYCPEPWEAAMRALRTIAHNDNVTVTAETEKYAKLLEKQLCVPVSVTGIPHILEPGHSLDLPEGCFLVACPGGARRDKGYYRIYDLAQQLLCKYGTKIKIAYQMIQQNNHDKYNDYDNKLMQLPNILPLPSSLKKQEYDELLRKASIVLLPYDRATYEWRGSSVLFDALDCRAPIVATHGTGLGYEIDKNGLGATFSAISECVEIINMLINADSHQSAAILQRKSQYADTLETNLQLVTDSNESTKNSLY